MAEFNEQEFKDADEVLDGNTYNRCTFTNCRLVYRGGTIPFLASRFAIVDEMDVIGYTGVVAAARR